MKDSTSHLQIKTSKSGHLIPVINQIFLHSEYDPIREAKKFADDHESLIFKNSHLIVYGLGFGYHLVELIDRLIKVHGMSAKITVVEPYEDLVTAFQENSFPFSKLISIYCTKDINQLFKQADFIEAISSKPPILKHPQSYMLSKDFFDQIGNYQTPQDLKTTRIYLKDFSVRRELGHYSQQSNLHQIFRENNCHDKWIDHLIAAFGEVAYQHEQGEMN